MKILDTNLWVFGTLGTNDQAARLLDESEYGETVSAINAYMVLTGGVTDWALER